MPGITITSLTVQMKSRKTNAKPPNLLQTHWTNSDVNMSRGLDFAPKGNVYARIKHLQHVPFSYKIRVENSSLVPVRGTVRIFLAPTKNEFDLLLTFSDQRLLMIEMDRFVVNRGLNIILIDFVVQFKIIQFDYTCFRLQLFPAPTTSFVVRSIHPSQHRTK